MAVDLHELVKQPDVEQGEGFLEATGDGLVRQAGFADARRMVMSGDQGCGPVSQGLLGDYARVHGGAVNGSVKQLFVRDDTMARVQEQAGEHLVRKVAQHGLEIAPRGRRAFERAAPLKLYGQVAFLQFEDGQEFAGLGGPQAGLVFELLPPGSQQSPEPAETAQQTIGQFADRAAR